VGRGLAVALVFAPAAEIDHRTAVTFSSGAYRGGADNRDYRRVRTFPRLCQVRKSAMSGFVRSFAANLRQRLYLANDLAPGGLDPPDEGSNFIAQSGASFTGVRRYPTQLRKSPLRRPEALVEATRVALSRVHNDPSLIEPIAVGVY
jgi:hypothetical protein